MSALAEILPDRVLFLTAPSVVFKANRLEAIARFKPLNSRDAAALCGQKPLETLVAPRFATSPPAANERRIGIFIDKTYRYN